MYSQETTRPHSQKIVPISIEMAPHNKKEVFFAYRVEIRMIFGKSGTHFREHADTHRPRGSVWRVQLEGALQSPTNHGYANMKIELIIYFVLSTLA